MLYVCIAFSRKNESQKDTLVRKIPARCLGASQCSSTTLIDEGTTHIFCQCSSRVLKDPFPLFYYLSIREKQPTMSTVSIHY